MQRILSQCFCAFDGFPTCPSLKFTSPEALPDVRFCGMLYTAGTDILEATQKGCDHDLSI
jgi:hypothetical protein